MIPPRMLIKVKSKVTVVRTEHFYFVKLYININFEKKKNFF
jgi:hypothetical protein